MARPEKPESQRRNRSANRRDWVMLPAEGRQGPPPDLPPWRDWSDETLEWWAEMWRSPQATMWDPSGRSLHALAILQDDLIQAAKKPGATMSATLVSLVAQMRQIQARHGLDPRSMADMKWKVADIPATTGATVLQLVPDVTPVPDRSLMPAKRATKKAWVDWAVACGMDRAAAVKVSKAKLIETYSSVGTEQSQTEPAPAASRAADRLRAAAAKKPPVKPSKKKS